MMNTTTEKESLEKPQQHTVEKQEPKKKHLPEGKLNQAGGRNGDPGIVSTIRDGRKTERTPRLP